MANLSGAPKPSPTEIWRFWGVLNERGMYELVGRPLAFRPPAFRPQPAHPASDHARSMARPLYVGTRGQTQVKREGGVKEGS